MNGTLRVQVRADFKRDSAAAGVFFNDDEPDAGKVPARFLPQPEQPGNGGNGNGNGPPAP